MSNICENCARRFCCQFNAQTRKVCEMYEPDIELNNTREALQAFDEAYPRLSAYCCKLLTKNFAAALGIKTFLIALFESAKDDDDTLAKLQDCLCGTEEGVTKEGPDR